VEYPAASHEAGDLGELGGDRIAGDFDPGRVEPGENPLATAAREIYEETGYSSELREIRELRYAHSFALGDRIPPFFVHETAFAVKVSGEPRLSGEHVAYQWVTPEEAMQLLPFAGFRRAVMLAAK